MDITRCKDSGRRNSEIEYVHISLSRYNKLKELEKAIGKNMIVIKKWDYVTGIYHTVSTVGEFTASIIDAYNKELNDKVRIDSESTIELQSIRCMNVFQLIWWKLKRKK